jgi:nucleoside-diphosphate-sugar epimerase
MNIALVTGITGFLGRHLASRLQAQGMTVIGITRNPAHPAVENLFIGNMTDRAFVLDLVHRTRPNLIFHLAANKTRTGDLEDFRTGLEENLFGTLNLVEACMEIRDLQRFISIGTCEEYGQADLPFHEEMRESPVSAYSLSKASVTHLLQTLYRTHHFPAVVLRPSLAYGPGQSVDMFLPALIQALLSGNRFGMSGGEQTRDYIYRDDLIEAILLASTKPEAIGKVINISSGVPILLKEIARLTALKIGEDAENRLDIGKIDYRANEIMEYVAGYQLAEKILGWCPRTALHDGLTVTVEYFRNLLLQESNRH